MLPSYQIAVLDCLTGDVLQIFDSTAFYDLRYNRALNDVGALVLTLPFDSRLPEIFAKDNFIEVMRASPLTNSLQVEETYFCRLTHRFREGNDERFIAGGLSLNHLLARRIIDPDDDPLGAGGYSTKAGIADEVLRAFAREQMGDLASTIRQFPNFSIDLVPGTGVTVGMRARYDNLLKVFHDLAVQGETDFQISRLSANNLHLTIAPIGRDRTKTANYPYSSFTQFDPNRGNLSSPSLVLDSKKEQNLCYALGQGQGDTRIVAKVTGDSIADTPYNRIEFSEDVRKSDRDNSLYLFTAARKALRANQVDREFTFDPIPNTGGCVYHLDWDLGDHVTAAWDNMSVDIRITDVENQISTDGEQIHATLEALYNRV
jgi:hypothetical protein